MKISSSSSPQMLWTEISESIKEHITENSFNTWLLQVQPLKIDEVNKLLILGVPNELTRGWIQRNYQKIITSELMRANSNIRYIKLTISRRPIKKTGRVTRLPQGERGPHIPLEMPFVDKNTNLNPNLSFQNFILAPYNRFAHIAATTALEQCGVRYNPLYFYGQTGVGKTHLLQAIGNHIKQNHPTFNVFYVSAEQFIEEYIDAVKKDRVSSFRNKYKSYQLLAIDDIQFFKKSESVLIELFHLFNNLINQNAQIVFSSDLRPDEIKGIEERIRSRLGSGIIVDIKDPEEEDIRIICREFAERMNLKLTDNTIEYITENTSQNIREIGGVLKNIHLYSLHEAKSVIDVPDAKRFLKSRIKKVTNISYDDLIMIVCKHYNIKKDLLYTKMRKREIVAARQVAMYIFREHFNMSYSFIGKKFGDRDHTTVIHACEKINLSLQNNPRLQRDLDIIRKKINI